MVLVWGVFGNSVGSVGAAPASFCVWVGKAAPALGRYCDALQWGGRHLPAWCWYVGVEWGGCQVGWEEEDKVKNGKEKEEEGKGTQKDAPAMKEAEAEV